MLSLPLHTESVRTTQRNQMIDVTWSQRKKLITSTAKATATRT